MLSSDLCDFNPESFDSFAPVTLSSDVSGPQAKYYPFDVPWSPETLTTRARGSFPSREPPRISEATWVVGRSTKKVIK